MSTFEVQSCRDVEMNTPNVNMSDYDQLGCLQDLFTKQAKETPDRVAVVDVNGKETTFKELDKMTDLLANKLQRFGLGRNNVAGILMERCLEYTVSYISILKAGGAYLPLEVSWPAPLLESVLQDATPLVICTKETFRTRFGQTDIPLIILGGNWFQQLEMEQKRLPLFSPIKGSLDDTAYIVYSSGTTGKPKGIQCPHRGAVFSYTWRHRAYPYKESDREACNVFFVWEMFRPIAKGAPMYVIPDNVIYDPPKLAEFIYKNEITRMLFTPSLLQALLEYKGINLKHSLRYLRMIIFCGEVVTTVLSQKAARLLPWVQQLNLYSISECHDVSSADVSRMQSDRQCCPVGKVLPGVKVVVMDEEYNVKTVGEPGEIYIGGPGLAHGYLKRPDLNKEKFISRPAQVDRSVGERLYRTGDWGYLLSDGSLEICGRCDSMVKIRGYTVELQAVKTTLQELAGISSACVLALGSEGGNKVLIAFVIPQDNAPLSIHQLRSQLKKKLPFYMIPSRFFILDSFPVVETTGKLDTKALAGLYSKSKNEAERVQVTKLVGDQEQAVTNVEMRIAIIWSALLDFNILDTEESFFDIGGHSLLAASLTSKLNETFNVNLSTAHVFKYPTISALAALITDSSCLAVNKKIDLQAEATKLQINLNGIDSRIREFWQTIKLNPNKMNNGRILLTGATGYVGCFLLQELLLHTETTIYCLVRESSDKSPLERLTLARQQFGLRKFLSADRVIPLKGDVSLTNLGLRTEEFNALSLEVDVVIHAAAQVNLILPYSALYSSNVLGTYNVLEFSISGKIKPLHYISTNAVFPNGLRGAEETADMSKYCDQLETGYGQTKWVAEQLVLSAAQRGFPTATYRCGNVGGSRLVPGWNPADFTLHMLKGVLKTGFAPNVIWQIELTPVDFVGKVIVYLVKNLSESVGKVFHLINNNTFDCKDLWRMFNELGHSVTEIPFNDWKVLIQNKEDTQLFHLLENLVLDETFFPSMSTFSNKNICDSLKKMNTSYPQLTIELFRWYTDNLSELGVIPKPKQIKDVVKTMGNLKGKVVVITGASSGIGEGIGRTLAKAGARVVLAARRLDRLQKIAEELKNLGAEAFPVEMDVCNVEQVSTRMQEIENNIGPVDVLVNNAGVMYYLFMKNCDLPRWQQMIDVNINGTLNCLSVVLSKMVARGSGHIINISSDGARKPFPGLAVYCGTKYFVRCLSGSLRSELASSGIKVTDIQPGDVVSELHDNVVDPEAELTYDWSSKVPILKPSDVGEAVLYALSQPSYCAVNEVLLEPQLLPL